VRTKDKGTARRKKRGASKDVIGVNTRIEAIAPRRKGGGRDPMNQRIG